MNELHALLKLRTREIHNSLEKDSIFRLLLSPLLTNKNYFVIINNIYNAYIEWQKQLDFFYDKNDINRLWYIDLKTTLLKKEISHKVDAHTANNIAVLKPSIKSEAHYLGCAYVFEGAKLGSKIIAKSLIRNNNITNPQQSYFCQLSQSSQIKLSWENWIDRLYYYSAEKSIPFNDIVTGAVSCFTSIHEQFKCCNLHLT